MAKFLNQKPKLAATSFVASGAQVMGAVELGEYSSLWFNVVARADINEIKIGSYSNVQDGTVLHVDDDLGVYIGDYVNIGHNAVIHGCHIKDNSLISMGAIVLNGAEVGEGAVVAAGAVVCENFKVPERSLVMGVPARVVREVTKEELEKNIYWAKKYADLSREYKE